MNITARDLIALALGIGYKVAGGDTTKAVTYALGARFALQCVAELNQPFAFSLFGTPGGVAQNQIPPDQLQPQVIGLPTGN
jgi:uncharacterized membrane-anchored protein